MLKDNPAVGPQAMRSLSGDMSQQRKTLLSQGILQR
jgi:hypothetical protein